MQHPKSKDVRKVVALLTSVLPLAKAECHLNMSDGSVNPGYVCGAVLCHGGWLAVACGLHEKRIVGFLDGAIEMDRLLFGQRSENYYMPLVVQWAGENHTSWGNPYGESMFTYSYAFTSDKRPDGAKNLQHIIDHWTEVAERLEALENRVEISDPPITAEELIESLEPVFPVRFIENPTSEDQRLGEYYFNKALGVL